MIRRLDPALNYATTYYFAPNAGDDDVYNAVDVKSLPRFRTFDPLK